MQEYSVILTWEAIYDVIGFADYIEASFGKLQADRFQRTIKEQMEKLGVMGKAFPETQLIYRGYVIHKKPFPPSIIFYVVYGRYAGGPYTQGAAGGEWLGEDT